MHIQYDWMLLQNNKPPSAEDRHAAFAHPCIPGHHAHSPPSSRPRARRALAFLCAGAAAALLGYRAQHAAGAGDFGALFFSAARG